MGTLLPCCKKRIKESGLFPGPSESEQNSQSTQLNLFSPPRLYYYDSQLPFSVCTVKLKVFWGWEKRILRYRVSTWLPQQAFNALTLKGRFSTMLVSFRMDWMLELHLSLRTGMEVLGRLQDGFGRAESVPSHLCRDASASTHPAIMSMTSGLFLKACFLCPTEAASNSLREVMLGVRVVVEKGGKVGMR